ncbi:MAG: hypothetical protein KBC84_10895 [Proteobacteria bacterium]|nr:hypothetical protein [Pseudomonadota bacterium]
MKSLFVKLTLLLAVVVALSTKIVLADQNVDKIISLLSSYDSEVSTTKLEELAGGKQQLIDLLLALRLKEKPPFVATRSEKILIGYSDEPRVAQILEQDMQDPNLRGLAQIITLHLDTIPSATLRKSLASRATTRARVEKEFTPYASDLKNSKDQEVRRIATESAAN